MPANRRRIGSDLRKVDAHIIQPHEYEEAPELTPEQLARAIVKRGRPALGDAAKIAVKLRIDPDTVAAYKAIGRGWQTRMNDDLRKAARRLKA